MKGIGYPISDGGNNMLEKDYNLLKPQSTIKTITSGEVDVSNGVEYNMDEISILEVQGVQ